jgi:pyruvate dehydrogenase kinase 2/3/4
VSFPKPVFSSEVKDLLAKASENGNGGSSAFPATENPSLSHHKNKKPFQNLRKAQVVGARYYGRVDDYHWPPEVRAYNNKFTKALSVIKRRHDPVVTTMGSPPFEAKLMSQRKEF